MNDKNYHHGNLRAELIEAGIAILNEQGYANLSLRKAAAACGVSHAAPYNHFANKDELLAAIQQHVEDFFARELQAALAGEAFHDALHRLGKAYVLFFVAHPQYFRFMLDLDTVGVVISARAGITSTYKPFIIFRDVALHTLSVWGVPVELRADYIAAMWAIVHGVAGMAVMKGVVYDGDWGALVEKILSNQLWKGVPHENDHP